jgi:NADPH-dependent glutamate synthase beta subunit-like oxidoreductase
VLDGEIARIVALGVEVRCGVELGAGVDLEQLRRQYDAVFVALGARRQKRLPQLDYRDRGWSTARSIWRARAPASRRRSAGVWS